MSSTEATATTSHPGQTPRVSMEETVAMPSTEATATTVCSGGKGEDVLYGGDGNDVLTGVDDRQRDKLYCGKGKDEYVADKNDYVDSSCEKKVSPKWLDSL